MRSLIPIQNSKLGKQDDKKFLKQESEVMNLAELINNKAQSLNGGNLCSDFTRKGKCPIPNT
jgi:hypothetical protein